MSQSRQLASIMFTDIVGYTARMGSDELEAFGLLKRNRELQRPVIEAFNGRFLKELGDGIMASFSTVSDSVYAAIRIQEKCRETKDYQLRIGIHLGEVVFENDDVFGDGVNIASRIQAVTAPGCIYVSESVSANVSNKRGIETKFVREERLKNVREPVRIYEVISTVGGEYSIGKPRQSPETLQSSGIAILPLINMSNDPEQDYFCDGISEEIMNALGQLNNLRVVARSSSFAFKGRNIDVREIGKSLDVSTVLEGSVRKAGKRLKIITQLISTSSGSQLWSNLYDRQLEDIFSIQEDIAKHVAIAVKGFLTLEEKEVIRRPETVIEAYEYFLKGRQLFHNLKLKDACIMFRKAIDLDSEYALAYAGLADALSWLYEWEGSSLADLAEAERSSQTALFLAPNLAESHSSRGYILSLGKRYDEAEKEFAEAIRLNSNCYDAFYLYGRSSFARGEIGKSAEMFLKASEVRQEDFQSLLLLAQSLRVLGRADERDILRKGISKVRKQLELNPADTRALALGAGSLYDLGEKEEAFQWIGKASELYPDDAGTLFNAAGLYAKDGNHDEAMNLLERAFARGYGNKDWIEKDPDYKSLRNQPRYKALMGK